MIFTFRLRFVLICQDLRGRFKVAFLECLVKIEGSGVDRKVWEGVGIHLLKFWSKSIHGKPEKLKTRARKSYLYSYW